MRQLLGKKGFICDMDTQGIKTILPPLPEVHFNGKSYDKIIQNAAYGNE